MSFNTELTKVSTRLDCTIKFDPNDVLNNIKKHENLYGEIVAKKRKKLVARLCNVYLCKGK